jgi:hypothetical protein
MKSAYNVYIHSKTYMNSYYDKIITQKYKKFTKNLQILVKNKKKLQILVKIQLFYNYFIKFDSIYTKLLKISQKMLIFFINFCIFFLNTTNTFFFKY